MLKKLRHKIAYKIVCNARELILNDESAKAKRKGWRYMSLGLLISPWR